MEEQIKLDNQVAQYAPILEQGQVGQIGQVETQTAVLVPKLNITNLSKVDSEPIEWLWPNGTTQRVFCSTWRTIGTG